MFYIFKIIFPDKLLESKIIMEKEVLSIKIIIKPKYYSDK